MNLNRVCAGSALVLYFVAPACIKILRTLHLVRGVALQSSVNALYFDAVLKEAKYKKPKIFLAVVLLLNTAIAMTLHSRVNRAVAFLFSIPAPALAAAAGVGAGAEVAEVAEVAAVLGQPDLLGEIFKQVPFNRRGNFCGVAKDWNAAIGEDPQLFWRSMNTLLTIMNAPTDDPYLRGRAAEALGNLGDRSAVDPLTAIMNAPANDPFLKGRAAEALGKLGDPSSVAPLTAIMNAPANDPFLKGRAAEALGKLGDPSGVPFFNSHSE